MCQRPCTGSWTRFLSGLDQVDVDDQFEWGVNSGDYIFRRPVNGIGGDWTLVPGSLIHVSASGNGYVWGVNPNIQVKETMYWRVGSGRPTSKSN